MTRIIFLLLLLFFIESTYAGNVTDKKVIAHRLSEPLVIDGKLDEPFYKEIAIDNFTQKNPDEGEPATEKTDVWVGYDDEFIYFSAKLYDSNPELIDQTLVRRDNSTNSNLSETDPYITDWSNSDWFIVSIDPFYDRRTGFLFAVNAGGSMADATISNDTWIDKLWDGVWESKVLLDKDGWNVEIRIPFSQLRFKESDEMKWGINFERNIKRKNEESYFVMVPKDEYGLASKMSSLEGLQGIKMKQRLEFLPYIVQKAQFLQHDGNDPFYKKNKFKTSIGTDFKVGIGSNLNIDGTINPDFGQVEVDPAVVNLTAFETFYQEKRPFFIEGSSIFNFGKGGANSGGNFHFDIPELFYTRRVGRSPQVSTNSNYDYIDRPRKTRILGAAKLTGKVDETWSIGMLSSITERTYATLSLNGNQFDEEIEPLTHYGVFRTQKQFNESKQGLGMVFTSVNRNVGNIHISNQLVDQAYSFGADGWTFLDDDEKYVVTASVIGSHISGTKGAITSKQEEAYRYAQRPDATYAPLDTNLTSLNGWFSRVMLNKQKGNFTVNAAIGAVSPGFDHNDIGFQRIADKINGALALGYQWFIPDGTFRSKTFKVSRSISYDFEGDRLDDGYMVFSDFEFNNYFKIDFRGGYFPSTISKELTRGGPKVKTQIGYFIGVNGTTDSRKKYIIRFNSNFGSDDLGGDGVGIDVDLQWKPLPQIDFTFGSSFNRNMEMLQWVTNAEDVRATETYGHRYVFGEMIQKSISVNFRLNWTFTPKLSIQSFIQPLISVGNYNNFKELAKPRTRDYNLYGENGSSINYNSEDNTYEVDPDGSGISNFSFNNPDFNFKSFRGNFVFRYEILPGSTLYFVWSNDRMNLDNPGNFDIAKNFQNLWETATDNVFLLKFTYWFDM